MEMIMPITGTICKNNNCKPWSYEWMNKNHFYTFFQNNYGWRIGRKILVVARFIAKFSFLQSFLTVERLRQSTRMIYSFETAMRFVVHGTDEGCSFQWSGFVFVWKCERINLNDVFFGPLLSGICRVVCQSIRTRGVIELSCNRRQCKDQTWNRSGQIALKSRSYLVTDQKVVAVRNQMQSSVVKYRHVIHKLVCECTYAKMLKELFPSLFSYDFCFAFSIIGSASSWTKPKKEDYAVDFMFIFLFFITFI